MTREEKKVWMAVWAADNGLQLVLEGECGFGRICVGVATDGSYPDYTELDEETYDRIDENGEVWVPEDAYYKAEVVAVLGRGEEAESQLYEWLKWFDENNFKLKRFERPKQDAISMIMRGAFRYMMVKQK